MKYREDRYGNALSTLGFGCMRFPQKLGRIDMAETEAQIMMAYHGGVNYYDTAYIYPGSEAALGEILHLHRRGQPQDMKQFLRRELIGIDRERQFQMLSQEALRSGAVFRVADPRDGVLHPHAFCNEAGEHIRLSIKSVLYF